MYNIKITNSPIDWESVPALSVDKYCWGGEYRPVVTFKIAYVPGEGFYVKSYCEESDPRATFTAPNSMVCKDSCLEFFAAFDITRPDVYINYEINPNGCALVQFGDVKGQRPLLPAEQMPTPVPYKTGNAWGWELFIDQKILDALFGEIEYKAGTVIRANCFKCGDDTAVAHYGSWNEIDWPYPSFHRPQFFGEMVLA